jgi:hypothetical protein
MAMAKKAGTDRMRGTWRRTLLTVGIVATTAIVGAAPAMATGKHTTTTISAATAIASTGRTEAELLVTKASQLSDSTASGGTFARAATISTVPSDGAGVYLLEASVRSGSAARVDLTIAGAMAGSYATTTTWKTVSAVVRLAPGEAVGTRSATAIDVDWLSLTPASALDTVRGSTIVDGAGAPQGYQGVNVPIFFSPDQVNGAFKITDMPVSDLWKWGADYVRLQLDQELWLADCAAIQGGTPTTYRAAVQTAVSARASRGLTVLLSLAVTQRGQDTGCTPSSAPYLKEMADTRSVDFWISVASTFKDKLKVEFDLFNEPNNITDAVWRNGGTVSYTTTVGGVRQTKTYQAAGMQALYDAVRSTGATNLVFVGGIGWATNTATLLRAPLDGYGIVGSVHVYCNGCDATDPHLPTNLDTLTSQAVLDRYPVVMTESGWQQSLDPTFNTASLAWAASHVDGWVMHVFYTGSFSLIQSWTPTLLGGVLTTKAPNVNGVPVWNALAASRIARGFPALPL